MQIVQWESLFLYAMALLRALCLRECEVIVPARAAGSIVLVQMLVREQKGVQDASFSLVAGCATRR